MRNDVLFKPEFRAWLETQKTQLVGMTRHAHSCPLATYLERETGEEWAVNVYNFENRLSSPTPKHLSTPKWAVDFIHNLDRNWSKPHRVIGEEALFILDEG